MKKHVVIVLYIVVSVAVCLCLAAGGCGDRGPSETAAGTPARESEVAGGQLVIGNSASAVARLERRTTVDATVYQADGAVLRDARVGVEGGTWLVPDAVFAAPPPPLEEGETRVWP